MNSFDKWDTEFNTEALAAEIEDLQNNKTERKEVTPGTYEVAITKLYLTETKTTGKPMVSCWFKVLAGEFKGNLIFMNRVIDNKYAIHHCNEFLRSLKTSIPVKFTGFNAYNLMLIDIKGEIDERKLEYQLNYEIDKKGYGQYTIENCFENDEVPF